MVPICVLRKNHNSVMNSKKSRWESSRKSLFVKTVWLRGYRHAVLFEGDPECLKIPRAKSSRVSSTLSKVSTRSLKTPKSPPCENFQVPSIKLLLTGIQRNKQFVSARKSVQESPSDQKTLSIDVIPGDKVKYQNIAEDVLGDCNQFCDGGLKTIKISLMSKRPDDCHQDACDLLEDHQNLNSGGDRYNNSLSERVLIWLDLAIQNNDVDDRIKEIASAAVSPVGQLDPRKISRSHSYDYHKKQEDLICLKPREIPCYSPLKINNLEEKLEFRKSPVSRTSSKSLRSTKQKTDILKRQLHIFMPKLPKKSDDGASSLSSKTKSSLVKRSSL